MNEIVKVNPADYGIEETKAAQISAQFKPMLDKMVELENRFNNINKMEMGPDKIKAAHGFRMECVKVRTATVAIHKSQKEFFKQGGLFVDGWKNAQKMASLGLEEAAKKIENYYDDIEREAIEERRKTRTIELSIFDVQVIPDDIGGMKDDVYKNYLTGVKITFDQRKKAEAAAERQRLQDEEIKNLHVERTRELFPYRQFIVNEDENYGLLPAEEYDHLVSILKHAKEVYDNEQIEIQEENKRLRIESEKVILKQAAVEKAAATKLRKVQAQKNKLMKKLQAEAAEKELAKEKIEAKKEADLAKGDEEKVADLIADLTAIKSKYEFKSKKDRTMFVDTSRLIDKLIRRIKGQLL